MRKRVAVVLDLEVDDSYELTSSNLATALAIAIGKVGTVHDLTCYETSLPFEETEYAVDRCVEWKSPEPGGNS